MITSFPLFYPNSNKNRILTEHQPGQPTHAEKAQKLDTPASARLDCWSDLVGVLCHL